MTESRFNEAPSHSAEKASGKSGDNDLKVCFLEHLPTKAEYKTEILDNLSKTPAEKISKAAEANLGKELWHEAGLPPNISAASTVSRVLQEAGELKEARLSVRGLESDLTSPERQKAGTAWTKHEFSERQAGDVAINRSNTGIIGENGRLLSNNSHSGKWVETSAEPFGSKPDAYVLRAPEKK